LGEDADNWITGYIRHHHGDVDWSGKEHKMQVIFHPFDKETQVPDRVRNPTTFRDTERLQIFQYYA